MRDLLCHSDGLTTMTYTRALNADGAGVRSPPDAQAHPHERRSHGRIRRDVHVTTARTNIENRSCE